MLLEITVSAPGKVILTGEHSVVYGKAAIAGAIGLRNTLTLRACKESHICLEFDLFEETFVVGLSEFNDLLTALHPLCSTDCSLPDGIQHDEFAEHIDQFVQLHCCGGGDDAEFQRTCQAALYLLAGIALAGNGAQRLPTGCAVRFASGLPKGAGLGSSASFGVCLAAAFHVLIKYSRNGNIIQNIDDTDRSVISAWAFCSERLMHGNPSGLDNTICSFGQLVKFHRGQTPEQIATTVPIDILLINSDVSRSTRDLVGKVATLKQLHPVLVDSLMQSLDCVAEAILKTVCVESIEQYQQNFSELCRLIGINNNLLRAIGVSHPKLEQIFAVCERFGIACKLTGAGGGGYAFALLPPSDSTGMVDDLCKALTDAGFEWYRTTVGGAGVLVEQSTSD